MLQHPRDYNFLNDNKLASARTCLKMALLSRNNWCITSKCCVVIGAVTGEFSVGCRGCFSEVLFGLRNADEQLRLQYCELLKYN